MSADTSHRALRQAVADFAQLAPPDAERVLGLMEPAGADAIRALLAEWKAPEAAATKKPAVISDWLAARLATDSSFRLTPATRSALAAYARSPSPDLAGGRPRARKAGR